MRSKSFKTPEFKAPVDISDESEKDRENEPTLPERLDDGEAEEEINKKVDLAAVIDEYLKLESACFKVNDRNTIIEATVQDLARLVLELKDKLADYDAIVSDDSSGRLPSLLFRRIINRQKRKSGRKGIQTFFVSSGRHNYSEIISGLREFFVKNQEQLGRVLLVTEYIDSGRSISRLIGIMQEAGVNFDLAAVSLSGDAASYNDQQQLYQHLRYGGVNNGGLYFFEHPGRGVKKNCDKVHPVKSFVVSQKKINASRNNINYLADQLAVLAD
ncbi:MAG: phosphoribosyltransferase [Patescibacteria group bacterium]|jgi:hypothetical protein